MIEAELVERAADRVAAEGIGPATVSALREEWPDVHFTHCMEDDIDTGRPVSERPGFAVYLVGGDHCLALTTDHEAASGLVFAEKVPGEE